MVNTVLLTSSVWKTLIIAWHFQMSLMWFIYFGGALVSIANHGTTSRTLQRLDRTYQFWAAIYIITCTYQLWWVLTAVGLYAYAKKSRTIAPHVVSHLVITTSHVLSLSS
jgi:hypothetical protein